ncbi:MAG: laccase domain-containing protein [Desulfamplus sp.]|nr:laccase domain-containing protein [Desulfamplus sp.]
MENIGFCKIKDSSSPLEYYIFDHLSRYRELRHAVFTRLGGVSSPPFDSLNTGMATGDDPGSVMRNREIVESQITGSGMEGYFLYLNQVHGREFVVLKKDDYKSTSEMERFCAGSHEADGIITDVENIFAVIQVADCQAVILYDPLRRVVAGIHSGWRGSLLNIIGAGVDIMAGEFGSEPGNIIAAISPSLGPCCAQFVNYKDEIPRHLWKYRMDGASHNEENNFDFWFMSRDQLMEKGVLPHNIEIAGICTPCRVDRFYSYRNEGVTGRFAVVAGVVSEGI